MKKIKKGLALALALFVGLAFSSFITTDDVHAAVKTPGKVTLASVKTVSDSQIKITWKKAANSPTGYQVYRGSSNVGTTKNLSFTNSGLKAGTTYSYKVRGYKKYTQKQYYNTKSKKWVTKKPKAKYWKGKKTRKVAKYKYGKFSSVKSAKTKATSSTPPASDSTDVPFDEIKNVTLTYGDATIHLGQKWTSDLKSQLAAGASGTDTVTRTNFIDKDLTDADSNLVIAHYTLNEDVYMFDTGDYDKFLAVYVAGGQIIKWTTNMSNMGSENGTALTRGTTGLPSHGQATMKNRLSSGAWWYNGISQNGVFIGGFQVETIYTANNWSRNIAGEKRIGMHFINAYRYLLGSQPLSYSNAIDGGNNICTKTYTTSGGKQYTNSRYGAQAFAETCSASKQCIHNTTLCKEGPLAGQGSGTRHGITCLATGEVVTGENVGTGALGEGCLTVYADSVLHLQAIYNPEFTKIGIGFGDMSYAVHAEQFAK